MKPSTLFVAKIVSSTSTDGVGLRNSLYVSGCNIRCEGCHNKDWWPIDSGTEMTLEQVFDELTADDFNVSILGGEPTLQYPAILELCKMLKSKTDKTIWLYTGYPIDVIATEYADLLRYIDVLVDGKFDKSQADRRLRFRGSKNQNIYQITHIGSEYAYNLLIRYN